MTTTEVRRQERVPLWRNVSVLKWVAQTVVLVGVLALMWILGSAAARNFSASGINFGFDWLSEPPGISIREGIDTMPNTGARALLVGLVNTLRVAISGIVAATIIGTLVGIFRLSRNFIVSKVATVYVETIRNIPLLVQIFFWQVLVLGLAELSEDAIGDKWLHGSSRGIATAWVSPSGGFFQWLVWILLGIIAAIYVAKWRKRRMEQTGHQAYAITWALGTLVVFGILGWFAHPVMGILGGLFGAISSFIAGLPSWLIHPKAIAF